MGRNSKYKIGNVAKYIEAVAGTIDFQTLAEDRLRKAAKSGNKIAEATMKKRGSEFADSFEQALRDNMGIYNDYSHVEYDVSVDDEGFPEVSITLDVPQNYSPSLYPKGYPDGILMPRMLDTGFDYSGGNIAFGKWVKHGIFTYGLAERPALNFIQETVDYFNDMYGIEIEINDGFYSDY